MLYSCEHGQVWPGEAPSSLCTGHVCMSVHLSVCVSLPLGLQVAALLRSLPHSDLCHRTAQLRRVGDSKPQRVSPLTPPQLLYIGQWGSDPESQWFPRTKEVRQAGPWSTRPLQGPGGAGGSRAALGTRVPGSLPGLWLLVAASGTERNPAFLSANSFPGSSPSWLPPHFH